MGFKSIINLEKPMPHLTLADWNSRVNTLRNEAESQRSDAFNIRHTSVSLRNDANIETNWNTSKTDETLSNRISELTKWRKVITRIYDRIQHEMRMLSEEKIATENELEAMQTPISVIGECLAMRDCRLGSEITYDDADNEIKNELAIAESNQRLLADQCQKAWEKLTRLEEVKFKLGQEIDNKFEAESLDEDQLALKKSAANITFKTDALRIPRNSCSYDAWLDHVTNMKLMGENELADTYSIREALFVSREKAHNLMHAQQERAEHAIRKRIFETQRARNELQWQHAKIQEEIQKAVCNLKQLKQSKRDKADAIKLAETRLENRAQRSGMELCIDDPHEKLCNEVLQLRAMCKMIENKIQDSNCNINLMSEHAERMKVDLNNKEHSLMTDMRALDLRKRLRANDKQESQTDRNIKLTHLEEELPKN